MRIVIGMSGGVDSSVAAALLVDAGHEVVGVTMKLWPCAELDGGFTRADTCCSPGETIDARSVALAVGARHYVLDAEDDFRRHVVDGFVAEYAAGRTPNPCVRCNETIKFGTLWDHARALGAERVATGHYARIARVGGRLLPQVAADTAKDQTYFLFSLTQEQLAATEFPIGHLTKAQVRAIAAEKQLKTAHKHESQDICFVGSSVADFLAPRLGDAFRPGLIRHLDGRALGEHRGVPAYTIGQRHGLGVAASEPLYVVALDAGANTVVVGPQAALLTATQALERCTWHQGFPPPGPVLVKPRYRSRGVAARIAAEGTSVIYDEPQARAAPGQACVVYDASGTLCLGGGWIA